MKKNYFKLMAACGASAMVMSCASTKPGSEPVKLNGKWDVIAVSGLNGPIQAENKPFIAFGENGQVSGNAGCNRMMGIYVADATKQTLSLDQMGSTRMMCRDMATEDALLAALGKVKAYRAEADDQLVLVDDKGTSLVTLKKAQTDK